MPHDRRTSPRDGPHPTDLTIRLAVLLGSALCLLPATARAVAKCSAADFGCAAGSTCVITGTHDIGAGCHLDFGSQDVEVQGTLVAEATGESYSITCGQLHLSGGKIKSTGDTTTSGGDITINCSGRFWMDGAGSRVDTSANAGGGDVDITSADVLVADGSSIVTDGGVGLSCGDAGDVSIEATTGPITLDGAATTVSASTSGYDCGGGSIVVEGPSLVLQRSIDGSGGEPFGVSLNALSGDVLLASGATVDARGRGSDEDFGNDGGEIDVSAVMGALDLQGGLNVDGSGGDGGGGDVVLDAPGDITIAGDVSLVGSGTYASGGDIEVTTEADLAIVAGVDASGGVQADGGSLDLFAAGRFSLASGGTVSVLGGAFGGGFIDIQALREATIDGEVDGRGTSGGDGGFVDVRGCQLSVSSTIDVTPGTSGVAGSIDLMAGTVRLTSTARLEAQPCGGGSCNTITLKSGAPAIDPLAIVEPVAGVVLAPNLAPCCGNGVVDDGVSSPIDVGEQCEDGNHVYCDGCTPSCLSEPSPPCGSDGNECTQDCSPIAGCTYAKLSGVPCSDEPGGNVCTTDTCRSGVCEHTPRSCSDGIRCTVDGCDPTLGCQWTNSDAACDDGEECTTDVCDPLAGDVRTGCVFTAVGDGTSCDDGSLCTTDDRCEGGSCLPQGPPLQCDDGDECTIDDCDAAIGCMNHEDAAACGCLDGEGVPLTSGTPCVDGNECTVSDTCDGAGSCVAGPECPDDGDPCTRQVCILDVCALLDDQCPTSGSCVDGEPCSDDSACTVGVCQGGQCQATVKPCDDGDQCTGLEGCFPLLGCRQISQPPIGASACDGYVTDVFTCYRTHRSSGTALFVPIQGVSLEDRFWARQIDVTRPTELCLPSSFAGREPGAVAHDDWILGYRTAPVEGTPDFVPQVNLEVRNVLGTVWVDAKRPYAAFAPTSGDLVSPPAAPTPPDPDSFECYRVGRSRGTPRFDPIRGVAIEDAFGSKVVDIGRPVELCNPANVEGQTPDAPSHPNHLLCYRVRESVRGAGFVPMKGIFTQNVIGPGKLDASRVNLLCLPSAVTAVGP